jgi:hypothetical protein
LLYFVQKVVSVFVRFRALRVLILSNGRNLLNINKTSEISSFEL